MKSTLILLVLLMHIPLATAGESSSPADPQTDLEPREETRSEDSVAPPVSWPKPFKPSEEIGADSQISFPTDI